MNKFSNVFFILSLILILIFFSLSCSENKQKPFTFVQVCDPQLGMGGYEHDIETFQQAVKQINKLDADFVLICGDFVHHATDSSFSDFLKIKEDFKMPSYVLPGNHDVGKVPNDSTLAYYREKIGDDYYEFQHKGYSFIVTNTQLWKSNVDGESKKHDEWFKEKIKNHSKQKPVFVIGHYPLFTKSPDEEEHYFNLPFEKRSEILELFQENNVVAYLSGHKHELVINNYKNIHLLTGETTSKNFDNRPLGFRLWRVLSDTIEHQFIPLYTKDE